MNVYGDTMPSGNPTSVTVWIVTSAPFEGTSRAAMQEVSVKDQKVTTLKEAVMNTYSKVGELPFSPVDFGVRQGDSVLITGQIQGDRIEVLG
jgi:hypothetical protein